MPSIADEMRVARLEGYLLGLRDARSKCIDEDGFHRKAAQIQQEIDRLAAYAQQDASAPRA